MKVRSRWRSTHGNTTAATTPARVPRSTRPHRCGNCNRVGHNARSCKACERCGGDGELLTEHGAVLPALRRGGGRVIAPDERWHIDQGDALAVLRTLPAGIAQTCVTSPPYWGLRDYGVAGQLGLE